MENKLRQLKSVSDIVDTMIKGLKKEWVNVDMNTFGTVESGLCFGCAATNTLCELIQEPFTKNDMNLSGRSEKLGIGNVDIEFFEAAIDSLRRGNTLDFLGYLNHIDYLFSFKLPYHYDIEYNQELPELSTDNYKENLHEYESYRDFLIAKGL